MRSRFHLDLVVVHVEAYDRAIPRVVGRTRPDKRGVRRVRPKIREIDPSEIVSEPEALQGLQPQGGHGSGRGAIHDGGGSNRLDAFAYNQLTWAVGWSEPNATISQDTIWIRSALWPPNLLLRNKVGLTLTIIRKVGDRYAPSGAPGRHDQ